MNQNPKSNENPWIVMTELTFGNFEDEEESAPSSESSSERQTPPSGTPVESLFGSHKYNQPASNLCVADLTSPASALGVRVRNYTHSTPTCTIKCAPTQQVPRSCLGTHFIASNAPKSFLNESQYDYPRANELRPIYSDSKEPVQERLGKRNELMVNMGDGEMSQLKHSKDSSKEKTRKKDERQMNQPDKQKDKNDQQYESKSNRASNSAYRQNNPETDEDSVSELDISKEDYK